MTAVNRLRWVFFLTGSRPAALVFSACFWVTGAAVAGMHTVSGQAESRYAEPVPGGVPASEPVYTDLSGVADPVAAAPVVPYHAPRWAMELKGGIYTPDLDDYEQFYGDDDSTLWGLSLAYRITNWLEVGGELGYTSAKGVGSLPGSGGTGGRVRYTLLPLQLFVNLRYDRSFRQLLVPYAGVGLVSAWYELSPDQQSGRNGFADIGLGARVGVQLLLNRLDRHGANYVSGDRRLRSFLFLEGQYLDTDKSGFNLGGDAYLLGLRFEFDGY